MKAGKARYWLDLYAESHRHPINILLHELGVPCIAFGILGGLRHLHLPDAAFLNLGTLFIAVYAGYYATLGLGYSVGILLEFSALYALASWSGSGWIALTAFVAGWILQFIGHWFEGTPPAAMKSPRHALVFPLMAPLFTLELLARRLRGSPHAA